jgi:hypothetical protein
MPTIYSIGLDERTVADLLLQLQTLSVREVADMRDEEAAKATGRFRAAEFQAALQEASILYLSLAPVLPRDAKAAGKEPGKALGKAVDAVLKQAGKHSLALVGEGADPDVRIGSTTLILELAAKGATIALAKADGEIAPISGEERRALLGKRASKSVTRGRTLALAGAAAAAILGTAAYLGQDAKTEEFMVSNLNPDVAYDKSGAPYRRLPDGSYAPLTEQDAAPPPQEQEQGQTTGRSSTVIYHSGGWGPWYSYSDYRSEGQAFRSGVSKPASMVSVTRGGFGASGATHAPSSSLAGHGSSGGGARASSGS